MRVRRQACIDTLNNNDYWHTKKHGMQNDTRKEAWKDKMTHAKNNNSKSDICYVKSRKKWQLQKKKWQVKVKASKSDN